MSAACCTGTRSDGSPCRAAALEDSSFCVFHDPAHQEALAAGRRKGGAAPRRRVRRFPPVLDHRHGAELLGELFVDALNDPDGTDTRRLQALTGVARLMLQAVGVPKGECLVHADRSEPRADQDHLLRVYPPLPEDILALLDPEPSTPSAPPPPDRRSQRSPSLPTPALSTENGKDAGSSHLPISPPSDTALSDSPAAPADATDTGDEFSPHRGQAKFSQPTKVGFVDTDRGFNLGALNLGALNPRALNGGLAAGLAPDRSPTGSEQVLDRSHAPSKQASTVTAELPEQVQAEALPGNPSAPPCHQTETRPRQDEKKSSDRRSRRSHDRRRPRSHPPRPVHPAPPTTPGHPPAQEGNQPPGRIRIHL